jgi:hypothetical protein
MGDKASRMVHMSVRMVRKGDKMVRKSAGALKKLERRSVAGASGSSKGRLPVNV